MNISNSGLCLENDHEVEFKDVVGIHEERCEFIDPCKFKLGDTIFELDKVYKYDDDMQNTVYNLQSNDWGNDNVVFEEWDIS